MRRTCIRRQLPLSEVFEVFVESPAQSAPFIASPADCSAMASSKSTNLLLTVGCLCLLVDALAATIAWSATREHPWRRYQPQQHLRYGRSSRLGGLYYGRDLSPETAVGTAADVERPSSHALRQRGVDLRQLAASVRLDGDLRHQLDEIRRRQLENQRRRTVDVDEAAAVIEELGRRPDVVGSSSSARSDDASAGLMREPERRDVGSASSSSSSRYADRMAEIERTLAGSSLYAPEEDEDDDDDEEEEDGDDDEAETDGNQQQQQQGGRLFLRSVV